MVCDHLLQAIRVWAKIRARQAWGICLLFRPDFCLYTKRTYDVNRTFFL